MRIFYATFALSLLSARMASTTPDCSDPNWHSLETAQSSASNCGPAFSGRCHCLRTCYDGKHQYIVNCTNSRFRDATPLAHLPNETQVLIFQGNEIEELPWNVFGPLDRLPNLRVIDMSNNKIREIRGKAYHHVQHVERLILDFNELSLDSDRTHPRVFSNFVSLQELHLTDAFEDGPPRDLAATLHDIFVSSNLTQLRKLHLEQNEISEFQNPDVFCDLPSLLDLHLGDNSLTALHFNLTCLKELRFLDLQRNKFARVREQDLRAMDSLAKHKADAFPKSNRSIMVDFSGNPFQCDCRLNTFVEWLKTTRVFVRNKHNLRCKEGEAARAFHELTNCSQTMVATVQRGMTAALFLLSTMLVLLVCALIYVQRANLRKRFSPVIESINKRVRYTSIATGETRDEI